MTNIGTSNSEKIEHGSLEGLGSKESLKEVEDAYQKDNQEQGKKDTHTEIIHEEENSLKVISDQTLQVKLMAPFTITYQKGRRHVFSASKRQGAMHSSSKPVKDKGKQPLKGKVKKPLKDKGKQPLKGKVKKPLKDKGKQQLKKEEDNHEEEREFELIHIDSDEENETRIVNSLLQDRNG